MPRLGEARRGEARRGEAWQCEARQGVARRGRGLARRWVKESTVLALLKGVNLPGGSARTVVGDSESL